MGSAGSNWNTLTVWSEPPRLATKSRFMHFFLGSLWLTALKVLQISLMSANHCPILASTPACFFWKLMPTLTVNAFFDSVQSYAARRPTFLTPSTSSRQSNST